MPSTEKMLNHLKYTLGEYYHRLSQEQKETFGIFYEAIVEANAYMNLTRILSEEDVANKHFADSVYPDVAGLFKDNDRVVDVGSGAGFPGIPLKIVRPDLAVTMVEATGKKAAFIKSAAQKCDIAVDVVSARAEELSKKKNYRETFDVCVSRAVAKLNILLELCAGFVKVGGHIFAYKGEKGAAEKEEAKKAANALGLKFIATHHIVDKDSERCILIYKKTKPLNNQYPRRFAMIKKSPL